MVVRICQQCGKQFDAKIAEVRRGRARFCSRKCTSLSQRKRIECICEWCGKTFENIPSKERQGRGRFCSRGCAAKSQRARVALVCEICGKTFSQMRSQSHQRFCSRKCYGKWSQKHRLGPNSANWKGGSSYITHPPEFNARLKRRVRKRDGNQCQVCYTRKPGLDVHHIDGNKMNNPESNLVTLCHPCHMRVHSGSLQLPSRFR